MDEIMSPMRRRRAGITFQAIVAGSFVFAGPGLAQQQAPAARTGPASAAKPVATVAPRPAAAAPVVPVVPGAPQPTLIEQFGEWGAYTATPAGRKVCFALSKPASSTTTPANRPRDPAWMFVSSRPGEKVKDEISVIFGYGLKPNTDANIEVAGASYAMYAQGDGAWVKNPAEESKLIDTLRKGLNVTVKGTSAKGTVSTDVYSLKGLSQALDRLGQECR
jgi:invasion protein IalB